MRVFIHPQRPAWRVIMEGKKWGPERLWLHEAIELAQGWVRGAGQGAVLICDHDGNVTHTIRYPFTVKDTLHVVRDRVGRALRLVR